MSKAISECFPTSMYQQCFVHAGRDIYSLVGIRDRYEILNNFKLIYHEDSLTSDKIMLKLLVNEWHLCYLRLINNVRNRKVTEL